MSPEQAKFFYFPEWNACARANGWNTQAGIVAAVCDRRAGADTAPLQGPFIAELIARVETCARQLAVAGHRHLTTNDFRHGCTIVALGKNKSSKDFTNDEVTRVVDLFRVLAQPMSIKAVQHWEDPLLSKKENLVIQAKAKAPMAYIVSIIKDRYKKFVLDDLQIAQLQDLCRLLNKRDGTWRKPARSFRQNAPNAQNYSGKKLQYVEGPF